MKYLSGFFIFLIVFNSLAEDDGDCSKQLTSPYSTQNVISLEKSLRQSRKQIPGVTQSSKPPKIESSPSLFEFKTPHNHGAAESFKARQTLHKLFNSIFEFDHNSSHRYSFTQHIRMQLNKYATFLRGNPELNVHLEILRQSIAKVKHSIHEQPSEYVQKSGGSFHFGIDDYLEKYFSGLDILIEYDHYQKALVFSPEAELPESLVGVSIPSAEELIDPFIELNIFLALKLGSPIHNMSVSEMMRVTAYIIDEDLIESLEVYLDQINWSSQHTKKLILTAESKNSIMRLISGFNLASVTHVSIERTQEVSRRVLDMSRVTVLSPQDSLDTQSKLNSSLQGSHPHLPPLPDF